MILETAVGRARVCGWRVDWQGATRRMAAPCNEEQRSQAARQPCNRVRSGLTRQVKLVEAANAYAHETFQAQSSGQLRFLG